MMLDMQNIHNKKISLVSNWLISKLIRVSKIITRTIFCLLDPTTNSETTNPESYFFFIESNCFGREKKSITVNKQDL